MATVDLKREDRILNGHHTCTELVIVTSLKLVSGLEPSPPEDLGDAYLSTLGSTEEAV